MRFRFVLLLLAALVSSVAFAQESQMDISWDEVVGADGYNLYWDTSSKHASGNYTNAVPLAKADSATNGMICNGATCEVVLRNLPLNIELYVSVKAFNAAGASIGFSRELTGWAEPVPTSIPSDCTPIVGGGANCIAHIVGENFAPAVTAAIPYTGVTVNNYTRIDAQHLDVDFTIAPSAVGGNADMVLRNPWGVTTGTEQPGDTAPLAGMAGDTFQGAITITPIVLPGVPSNFIRIER